MDLVGLIAYRYIVFLYIVLMYFSIEAKNDIRFLDKSMLKIVFKIKLNFSLCNTEETKTLIFPMYYKKKGAYP